MAGGLRGLRRSLEAAEAAWRAESAALADGLLAIGDPEARAEAYAALEGRLARNGYALLLDDEARVLRSFGPGTSAAEPPEDAEAAPRAEHERAIAAWCAELAARDAALARAERRQRLLVWGTWLVAGVLLLVWLLARH